MYNFTLPQASNIAYYSTYTASDAVCDVGIRHFITRRRYNRAHQGERARDTWRLGGFTIASADLELSINRYVELGTCANSRGAASIKGMVGIIERPQ